MRDFASITTSTSFSRGCSDLRLIIISEFIIFNKIYLLILILLFQKKLLKHSFFIATLIKIANKICQFIIDHEFEINNFSKCLIPMFIQRCICSLPLSIEIKETLYRQTLNSSLSFAIIIPSIIQ